MQVSAHTALITGASRGIGAAAARALARAGVRNFILHYQSHEEGAIATREALAALGASAELWQADLSEDAGIDALCRRARSSALPIDILINNAGSLIARARLLEFTPLLFDRVMNLNVKSAWFLTQAVAAGMIARRQGVIVNLSSIAARNGGGPGATVYAAAKAAVSCLTKGLAKELAPLGIRVNAVSPGTVANDFHARFSTPQILENVRSQTPAGTLGTNEEIADVIVFLCSSAARYIHGQTIEVNGGILAP